MLRFKLASTLRLQAELAAALHSHFMVYFPSRKKNLPHLYSFQVSLPHQTNQNSGFQNFKVWTQGALKPHHQFLTKSAKCSAYIKLKYLMDLSKTKRCTLTTLPCSSVRDTTDNTALRRWRCTQQTPLLTFTLPVSKTLYLVSSSQHCSSTPASQNRSLPTLHCSPHSRQGQR